MPADCNLLIIAGPRTLFSNLELQKIDQYLSQGGRLFLLLDYSSIQHPTGLEDILRRWGVNVGGDVVQDPQHTISGQDVVVLNFSQHPVVNPLTGLAVELILPRPVSRINWQNPPPDAPKVEELAFSGPDSVLMNERGLPSRRYPLMAAIEQNEVKGVAAASGGARMVVVGDSFFLDNQVIEAGANRDFAGYAVNWLLARPTLLKGIGPRPVVEFRLYNDAGAAAQSPLAVAGGVARRRAAGGRIGLAAAEKIMNSKNTLIWFVVAAALFAFIFVFDHFLRPSVAEPSVILPGLQPATVASVQVIPANALEIRVDHTNGAWLLTKPVVYPAQPAAIEDFAGRAAKTHARHPHQRRRTAQTTRCGRGIWLRAAAHLTRGGRRRRPTLAAPGGQQNCARRPGFSPRGRNRRRICRRCRLA